MLIWGSLTVPIIFVIVLSTIFKRKIVWWELFVPLIVSAILIAICKVSVEKIQTNDTEYWGGYVQSAEYYENWDEEVPCRHDRYENRIETYTSSNGKTQTRTVRVYVGKQHAYDVDDHPPYWVLIDSNGIEIRISRARYNYFCQRFKNNRFVDLHRDYHSNDGDKYITEWNSLDETIEPVVTTHTYENRVQASNSVFKFEKVNPKIYSIYKYPGLAEGYICPTILGYSGSDKEIAEKAFGLVNAKLGRPKQVRVWVLVFTDKPIQAGFDQQNFWQGGNKNEFIITIGINRQQEVQWAHVFSWSEVEDLKIDTRDYITGQKKLNLIALAQWLYPQINSRFVRKQFKDFSYLSVEPPGWMIFLSFILTLLANILVSFWLVKNDYTDEGEYVGTRPGWRTPVGF